MSFVLSAPFLLWIMMVTTASFAGAGVASANDSIGNGDPELHNISWTAANNLLKAQISPELTTGDPNAPNGVIITNPYQDVYGIELAEPGQVGYLRATFRIGTEGAPARMVYSPIAKRNALEVVPNFIDYPSGERIEAYEMQLPEGLFTAHTNAKTMDPEESYRFESSSPRFYGVEIGENQYALPAPFNQIKTHSSKLEDIVIDPQTQELSALDPTATLTMYDRVSRIWDIRMELLVNGSITAARVAELKAQADNADARLLLLEEDQDNFLAGLGETSDEIAAAEESYKNLLVASGFSVEIDATGSSDYYRIMSENPDQYEDLQRRLREAKLPNGRQLDLALAEISDRIFALESARDQYEINAEMGDVAIEIAEYQSDLAHERFEDAQKFASNPDHCSGCVTDRVNLPRVPGKYRLGSPKIVEFESRSPVTARNEDGRIQYTVHHSDRIVLYYPIFMNDSSAEGALRALAEATDVLVGDDSGGQDYTYGVYRSAEVRPKDWRQLTENLGGGSTQWNAQSGSSFIERTSGAR